MYYKEKDTISPFREDSPIVQSKKTWYGRVPSSTQFFSSVSLIFISVLGLSDIHIFSLTLLISDPVSINPFVFTLLANIHTYFFFRSIYSMYLY